MASDPVFYKKFRHAVEHDLNVCETMLSVLGYNAKPKQSVAQVTLKDSGMQKAVADAFRTDMEIKLAQRPDLRDKSV